MNETLLCLTLLLCGCVGHVREQPEMVSDYRNGKPNALVCPDNCRCFKTDHETAARFVKLYAEGKWDGGIVFLPIDQQP